MKTIGIVAEYNPFHNGHQKLIEWGRAQGYSHCVAVMSGNFVQRCAPAVAEKHVRTHAALLGGTDLVLELPVAYATATAQKFAQGAVGILKNSGIVDALCFGSESGNIVQLQSAADLLLSPELTAELQKQVRRGLSFAQARALALAELDQTNAETLASPNNTLAIEYLLAARRLHWEPEFLTMPRLGVAHHSLNTTNEFASASYLRSQKLSLTKAFVPAPAYAVYRNAYRQGHYGIRQDAFEMTVLSHLRRLTLTDLKQIPDLSEGAEHRIYKAIGSACSLEELYSLIKTKRYPHSRVRRWVLSAFLGITPQDQKILPYIRVLGFHPSGRELLTTMKTAATLPFGTRLLDLEKTPEGKRFADLERTATDQYGLLLGEVQPKGLEERLMPVVL